MEFLVLAVVVGIIWWLYTNRDSPAAGPVAFEPEPEILPRPAVTRSGETIGTGVFGRSKEITSGKEGTIFEIPEHRLIDVDGRMVFKRLADPSPGVSDQFEALCSFLAARPPIVVERIIRSTAWPLQLTLDGGIPSGFVMRRATQEFWIDVTGPKGRRQVLAEMPYLASDDAYLKNREISPMPTCNDRNAVLGELAEVLSLLHEGGATYGDLSLVNTAYSIRPAGVFLLDCDSIRVPDSPSTLNQLHAADYVPPEAGPPTAESDVYKFACVVRDVLAQPLHARSEVDRARRAVEQMPGPLGELLLQRSLAEDPGERPRMREWADFLKPAAPPQPTGPPPPSVPPQPQSPAPRTGGGWVKDAQGRWVQAGPGVSEPPVDHPPPEEPSKSKWVRDPTTGEYHRRDR